MMWGYMGSCCVKPALHHFYTDDIASIAEQVETLDVSELAESVTVVEIIEAVDIDISENEITSSDVLETITITEVITCVCDH